MKNVVEEKHIKMNEQNEPTFVRYTTSKQMPIRDDSIKKSLDLNEIKNKIKETNRLAELKASIDNIKKNVINI